MGSFLVVPSGRPGRYPRRRPISSTRNITTAITSRNANETTQGVGTNQSQQPKDQQNNSNGVQHGNFSFRASRRGYLCIRPGLAGACLHPPACRSADEIRYLAPQRVRSIANIAVEVGAILRHRESPGQCAAAHTSASAGCRLLPLGLSAREQTPEPNTMQTRNELPVANDLLGAMPRQAYRHMQTSLESVELAMDRCFMSQWDRYAMSIFPSTASSPC